MEYQVLKACLYLRPQSQHDDEEGGHVRTHQEYLQRVPGGEGRLFDESMDPIMGNSLVAMSGRKWKAMRAYLSPAFTGSKMRLMFNLVRDVTGQLTSHLKEQCKDKPLVAAEYNVKNLCASIRTT